MYPLSRFAPPVGLFKLFKLAYEGVPLAATLDVASWMTLACLDDAGADQCISQTAEVMVKYPGCQREMLNTTFAHVAAPFLVPMLVPYPVYQPTPAAKTKCNNNNKTESKLPKLHGSVLRLVCAIVKELKLDFQMFEDQFEHLHKLTAGAACRALREFAQRARDEPAPRVSGLLREVLCDT
jgi:hypothetical protein